MAVLIGIDEAGYGPILGPLVASSAAFSIPDAHLKSDLWQLLSPAVAKKRKHLAGRLLIADSKKAYSKSIGITHLRRTVLAGLLCADGTSQKPTTAAGLLDCLCPQCTSRLAQYPWYQNLSECALGADADDLEIASGALKSTLSANKMKLLGITSACLDVGYYNEMVSAVKNKANVLFTAICSLIKQAFDAAGDSDNLQVIIDKQSGRTRYRKLLGRMFEELELKILREDGSMSSYELAGSGKVMRLHFAARADDRFLPVSLASMTSKYVRQVLMESINSYFITRCTHLKPTAGYWKDGTRFIEDIESNPARFEYDSERLIRCR
jgi:ribonuclease HII